MRVGELSHMQMLFTLIFTLSVIPHTAVIAIGVLYHVFKPNHVNYFTICCMIFISFRLNIFKTNDRPTQLTDDEVADATKELA